MGYFEEQFGDYHKEDTSLPDDFSWEEMAPGIYDRMEQNRRRRFLFWWWILLPLLGGTYFWFGEEPSFIEPTSTSNPNQVSQIEVAYSDVLPKRRSKQGKTIDKNLNYWTPQSSIFTNHFSASKNSFDIEKVSSSAVRQKGVRSDLLQEPKLNVFSQHLLLISPEPMFGEFEKEPSFKSIYSIAIFGGMGLLEQGFSDNVNSPYLSVFPDVHFGLEGQWEWKKGHALSAAWTYQRWTEEFFFEDRDEMLTEIPNQLIYRRESTITGNVIGEQYGTALTNSVRYRKERSYNQIQAHLFSAAYERIWSLYPKQSLSVGFSFHGMFGLKNDGRRLNANGEIQDIEGQVGYRSVGALAGLQLRYAYQVYPDWAVWFRIQGLQSFTNWDESGISDIYPRIWNAQLGVSYHLATQ